MEQVFSGFSGTPLVHSQGPAREQESSPQGDMRGCEPLGVTHTTSSYTIEARLGGRSEPGREPLPSAGSVQSLLVTKLAKEKCLEVQVQCHRTGQRSLGPQQRKERRAVWPHVLSQRWIYTKE